MKRARPPRVPVFRDSEAKRSMSRADSWSQRRSGGGGQMNGWLLQETVTKGVVELGKGLKVVKQPDGE